MYSIRGIRGSTKVNNTTSLYKQPSILDFGAESKFSLAVDLVVMIISDIIGRVFIYSEIRYLLRNTSPACMSIYSKRFREVNGACPSKIGDWIR